MNLRLSSGLVVVAATVASLSPSLKGADEQNRWDRASSACIAAIAKISSIQCERTEEHSGFVAIGNEQWDDEPKVTRRSGSLTLEGTRIAYKIREETEAAGWFRESWRGFDGKRNSGWTRSWDGEGFGACDGFISAASSLADESLASELTPLRFLGANIRGSEMSLAQLLDDEPIVVVEETIGTTECIAADFTLRVYPFPEAPPATIRVTLDPTNGFLPVRIRSSLPAFEIRGMGKSAAVSDTLVVTRFQSFSDPTTGAQVIAPVVGTRTTGVSVTDVKFTDVRVNHEIDNALFQPKFPYGCRVVDKSKGKSSVRFEGGKSGQREWMEKAQIDEEIISKVMGDPVPGLTEQAEDGSVPQQANSRTVRSARPADNLPWSYSWLLLIAAVAFGFIAYRLRN